MLAGRSRYATRSFLIFRTMFDVIRFDLFLPQMKKGDPLSFCALTLSPLFFLSLSYYYYYYYYEHNIKNSTRRMQW